MSEVLRVEGVCKTWATAGPAPVRAVRDASLAVGAGEAVVITGPSGSGKTTLLSLCGGLVTPEVGRILLTGHDLAALRRRHDGWRLHAIGFVFQRGLLLRHLSVRQNVALVPRAAGRPWSAAYAAADAVLERLELAARAHLLPGALSAGECQRAALARAVVLEPRLLLADEPTAHLDAATGARVTNELRALARERGAALLVVTHDVRLLRIADRVLVLEDGVLRPAGAGRDVGATPVLPVDVGPGIAAPL